jgi:hypothetical protein
MEAASSQEPRPERWRVPSFLTGGSRAWHLISNGKRACRGCVTIRWRLQSKGWSRLWIFKE